MAFILEVLGVAFLVMTAIMIFRVATGRNRNIHGETPWQEAKRKNG